MPDIDEKDPYDFDVNDIFGTDEDDDDETDETEDDDTEETDESDDDESDESDDDSEDDDETEDDETEDADDEVDPDVIAPVTIAGRTYTSLAALTKDLEAAQNHIKSTTREERTSLEQAIGGIGGSGSWQAAWNALPEKDQASIDAAWKANPEKLALTVANDTTILGPEISAHIFNEWAKAEPYKAMIEMQRQFALTHTAPAVPDVINEVVAERTAKQAREILPTLIPGYDDAVDAELAAYITFNIEKGAIDNSTVDHSDPQALAQFLHHWYLVMEGQKAAAARGGVAKPAAGKKRSRTNKSKATTPVKGGKANPAPDAEPDFFDEVFAPSESSIF